MGYTTVPGARHEPTDLLQTPAEVKAVRERAGFTQVECDDACWFSRGVTVQLEFGLLRLSNTEWHRMKSICGAREFDHE